MQAINRNREHFSERTDELAKRLGVPLRQLGAHIELSTSILFAYRAGTQKLNDKAWSKLERAEAKLERAEIGTPQELPLREPQPHHAPRVLVNPAYATPPPQPTRAQIEARVKAFLDAAEKIPGGLGFASLQVKLHLNTAALEALQNDE